jgi:hypothetical protein
MKTPREILLQRHQAAIPKLDTLRRDAVRHMTARQPSRLASWILYFPWNCWCEMIWPARRIWTGLAATWVLLLIANLGLRAGMPQRTATISANSYGFLLSAREQEQLLGEFNEPLAPPKAAPPLQPPFLPRPRTERRSEGEVI